MPERIRIGRKRLVVIKVVMNFMQALAETWLHEKKFATVADDVLLCCAIYVGQAERRPFKVAKLASYAGLPRTTVIRRLKGLQERGIIEMSQEGRYVLMPVTKLNDARVVETFEAFVQHLQQAAAKLAEMDT